MDSIFAITLGFALRLVVDATSPHNDRIGGSLVGLWEGAVLYHFLEKWPMSFDPYVGLGFRLFVDFLFTESVHRLVIVLLWTGLSFILSDVTPAFWYDKNLRRFYRRTRRFIRHFDWRSLKFPLPTNAISRVRFYELPTQAGASAPASTSPHAPSAPSQRRHSVPGNFPGYTYSSSTDGSNPQSSSIIQRHPIPATSLPPSALRSVSQPKPSSSSSVSFDLNPPSEHGGRDGDGDGDDDDDDGDSFEKLAADHTPTPKHMPPTIVMSVPLPEAINSRTLSADPTSSTLTPANIDLLPEIVEPREDPDPDPPPPFDFEEEGNPDPTYTATGLGAVANRRAREWGSEKLTVRNPADRSEAESVRSSIISGGDRNSIIIRADLLREQARAEEKERDRLHAEQKKAFSDKRYADAVRHKVEQEEASERAMNLHRRAAERYFKGAFLFFDRPYRKTQVFSCGTLSVVVVSARCVGMQRIIFSRMNARSTCIGSRRGRRFGGPRSRSATRLLQATRASALSVGEGNIRRGAFPS